MIFGLLIVASWFSIKFAIADALFRQNTLESLQTAVALAPGNAAYHALLAEHLEGFGSDPDAQLLTASALSPLESRYWIRLGFRAESEHQYGKAEQHLLHAASVDRKFDPRWALMNFYFRRGRMVEFWRWMERAFEYSYGDVTPIFSLAWEASQDSAEIRKHLPGRRDILLPYLNFLVSTGRLDASAPIAREIAGSTAHGDDTNPILSWWEQVHESDNASALSVWNLLCERHALPYLPLQPAMGSVVTNGNFSMASLRRGFDWRLAEVDGASVILDNNARELNIAMSGKEPEDLVLAEEWVPVVPGQRYLIRWDYEGRTGTVSGLSWSVTGPAPNREAVGRSTDFTAGAGWKSGAFVFDAGTNQSVRLSLRYTRPLGSVRAEGTVGIRDVASAIAE